MIYYKSGYKYQLTSDYTVKVGIRPKETVETERLRLTPEGILTILKGYAWDGPSGPTLDTRSFMRGSLVHDALYQLIRMELLPKGERKAADKVLRRICKEDGMWSARAWWVYKAVQRAGGSAADPDNRKKIKKAPSEELWQARTTQLKQHPRLNPRR